MTLPSHFPKSLSLFLFNLFRHWHHVPVLGPVSIVLYVLLLICMLLLFIGFLAFFNILFVFLFSFQALVVSSFKMTIHFGFKILLIFFAIFICKKLNRMLKKKTLVPKDNEKYIRCSYPNMLQGKAKILIILCCITQFRNGPLSSVCETALLICRVRKFENSISGCSSWPP